jgi:hypothetical protein
MNLPSKLINSVVLVVCIGCMLAVNLVIAGLIVIAVAHDGATANNVAASFQTILTTIIAALGTLLGSLITGRAVHNAMLAGNSNGNGGGTP